MSTEKVQCDYCLEVFPLSKVRFVGSETICISCGAFEERTKVIPTETSAPPPPVEEKTPEREEIAQKEMAERELCRRHLIPFVCRFKPDYKVGWVHKVFAAKLEKFFDDVVNQLDPRLIIQVPPRHGKLCAHSTPVLTANRGWTTHGDLRVGDKVYAPSGKPVAVIALSEDAAAGYEVEFSNGETITVHANHEWVVRDRRRGGKIWRTMETREMARDFWIGPKGERGGRARWQVQDVEGVDFPKAALPMDPYVLGVWLGDGTVGRPGITNSEEDSIVFQGLFAEAGYPCTNLQVHPQYGTHTAYFYRTDLAQDLRNTGVFAHKHIPEVYLRGSKKQRRALLAGLIDTDGHVEKRTGRVRFVTTSEELRDGVVDLATTLGYRPYVSEVAATVSSSGVEGQKPVFTVSFQPHEELLTRLDRKRVERFAVRRRVSITSIRRVRGELGRCIQVAPPDGLYLVGRSLIPTHNSELVSNNFPSWALGKRPDFEIIMTAHTLSLPLEFSKANRDRMTEERYKVVFPDVELDQKTTSAERWKTVAKGGIKCAGVGGGIGGFGAHILIIDDPIKDFEDSQSETIRETVKNWYSSTAEARLAPGGGVIIVMCMTGDTAVLMSDGTQRRLDSLRPGDEVASYDNGELAHAKVLNFTSQGCDSVFRITTKSGRVAKANARHPFLVERGGVRTWVRMQSLELGDKLIACREVRGPENSAASTVVRSQPNAADFATPTTISGNGLLGTAPHPHKRTPLRGSTRSSNTGTGSHWKTTARYLLDRAVDALSAGQNLMRQGIRHIGRTFFVSTTATTPVLSEGSSATDATFLSGEGQLPNYLKPQRSTFEADPITAIDYVGEEEVFDVQIERTENFIANGLVSHNTRWHDDDLAGAQLSLAKTLREEGVPEEEINQWEVVSFPAISEDGPEYLTEDLRLVDTPEPGCVKVRDQDQALHPARYNLTRLKRKRASTPSQQWSALYQQKPVPDSGEFFTKDDFVYYTEQPQLHHYPVIFAWDLAVGEKHTNDYTVGLAGLVVPVGGLNQVYLLDHFRKRVRDKEQLEAITGMYLRFRQNAYSLGLEYGQIFLAIEKRLLAGFQKHGITPSLDRTLVPVRDKRVRATPARGWMQNHRVWFPKHQPWAETMRDEMLRFDAGVHDDHVDALAWLIRMAEAMPLVQSVKVRRNQEDKTVAEQLNDFYRQQQLGDNGSTGHMTA